MTNSSKKEFFRAHELIRACEDAIATVDPGDRPLAKIFSISTMSRPGPNGVKYLDVYCVIPGRKRSKLRVQFINERHVGRINPLDEEEVNRLNREAGEKFATYKKRDRKPQLSIQKYATFIRTDEKGDPVEALPEDQRSNYFRVIEYLNAFFEEEIQNRLDSGKMGINNPKRTQPPDFISVSNPKIVSMIQTHSALDKKTNSQIALVNPICRITISFGKNNQPRKVQFFDGTKPNREKQNQFEPLMFGGRPVAADNIHMIASHSTVSGIVDLGSVCLSNMGISLLAEPELVVVNPPVREDSVSLAEAFSEEEFKILLT